MRRDMALTAAQVAARQRPHGRLTVISVEDVPLEVGTAFPLLPITTFGRAPTNTIQLPDSFSSGRHALLTLRTGRWWLEDAGSRNGTTLNGQLLEEPTVISAGDVIGVGRVEFKVELE
jgi:pSer/pThr/pTyr-binding forkhead associated (FHA) protein